MTSKDVCRFVVHDNYGVKFQDGSPNYGTNSSNYDDVKGNVRSFASSKYGQKFAWVMNGEVCVVEGPKWQRIGTLKHPRAQEIAFSPGGSYLAVWDTYTTSDGTGTPNMSVYDVNNKKLLKSFFQQSQVNWKPQWTHDEAIFARNVTNEVHFYKADDLQTIAEKKILPKVRSFSISPSTANHFVTFFVPGLKGAPAYVHLYRYPHFKDTTNALANKAFYKVDTMETFWNDQSTGVLLLTTAETDKTNTSYYGAQSLFFLTVRGDSSRITFSQDAVIRSVAWCPNGKEFFAVYGSSPARATMYNHKCDAVAEFGDGARNTVLVNPTGNIVLLGGFGNISSRFELYDIATGKEIARKECPDITHIEWSPCGQYLLSSTCSPRLRVNNGYKVWHYTATLMHEVMVPEGTELYKAVWLLDPEQKKDFTASTNPVQGIASEVKTGEFNAHNPMGMDRNLDNSGKWIEDLVCLYRSTEQATFISTSAQRYIPPSQRSAMAKAAATNKVELSTRYLSSQKEAPPSKNALKNRKKKEAKKRKDGENDNDASITDDDVPTGGSNHVTHTIVGAPPNLNLDVDTDKKIKNVKKKLSAITKLKKDKEGGKTLEKNQLEKIETEAKLLQELNNLQI